MAVLAPLFDELEHFLRTRQRGITTLLLQLAHRNHAPTRCVLKLAAPAQHARQFLRLLELQLGRAGLPAPVRRCELRSGPLVEAAQDSDNLWRPGEHGGGRATLQMPSFLEQLRARLGEEAVTGLAFNAEHRPDRVNLAAAPVTVAARRGAARSVPAPPWPSGRRPLWLLTEPAALAEHEAWPCRDGHRLRLLGGPERLETGWWDGGDVTRDYYQAEDAAGARLWIFRERRSPQRWFLHGFFG
ncbi:hypothetical protein EON77_03165 [bacterium]|nr:MAG: hypothetical protein EON77_03165 [bacterium]